MRILGVVELPESVGGVRHGPGLFDTPRVDTALVKVPGSALLPVELGGLSLAFTCGNEPSVTLDVPVNTLGVPLNPKPT